MASLAWRIATGVSRTTRPRALALGDIRRLLPGRRVATA
jgi:hypothetical protein